MAKLNTIEKSKLQSVIVYGAPKSGKTLLAGKLAEHFKLLWIDMEHGYNTLFELPQSYQENIELITLPDTRDFPIAIETCLKLVKQPVNICEQHGKVSCVRCKTNKLPTLDIDLNSIDSDTIVVFDSLTQLTNSAIANITKNQPDDYKLTYDDWGNLGKLLDIFLSHLQQARYNTVVISHEQEVQTEGKKNTLVPVGGTRNFSRNVAKYFDTVVYAERKNKKHVFASSSVYATNIMTGSRQNVALEENTEATLLSIFKPEVVEKTPAKSVVSSASHKAGTQNTSALLSRLRSTVDKK